jgi:hypothetical protein
MCAKFPVNFPPAKELAFVVQQAYRKIIISAAEGTKMYSDHENNEDQNGEVVTGNDEVVGERGEHNSETVTEALQDSGDKETGAVLVRNLTK